MPFFNLRSHCNCSRMHFVRTFYRFNGETSLLLFKKSTNWRTHKGNCVIHREISKTFYLCVCHVAEPLQIKALCISSWNKKPSQWRQYPYTCIQTYLTGNSPGSVSHIQSRPVNKPYSRDLTCHFMLISPNECDTAVHGFHSPGNMAVCMRKVLTKPWVGVFVPLALSLSYP